MINILEIHDIHIFNETHVTFRKYIFSIFTIVDYRRFSKPFSTPIKRDLLTVRFNIHIQ